MTKVRHVQMSAFPDLQPDKPIGPILPSVFVGTNAELMAAVAPFYLTGSVMDCTFGQGSWWNRFRPQDFVTHDLYTVDGVDFRALPEATASIGTVCFDPPYTISGGIDSSTAGDFLDRYGIGNLGGPAFYLLIRAGLIECARVVRVGGFVLVKCMEFAQGSTFHDMPVVIANWAAECGLTKHDIIVHHTGSGPGGHNIFDPTRARRHHSYLLVFTKATP